MTQPGILPVLPSPRLPKPTLTTIFQLASGVQVYWSTSRTPQRGQKVSTEHAWITASMRSVATIAVDEKRLAWNPVTNTNETTVVAHRAFTVSLRAESFDTTLEAYDLLERVRIRLRGPQIRALMEPTIALETIKNITALPDQDLDGRALRVAVLDVRMRCALTFANMDPSDTNWIEADSDNFADVVTTNPLIP